MDRFTIIWVGICVAAPFLIFSVVMGVYMVIDALSVRGDQALGEE